MKLNSNLTAMIQGYRQTGKLGQAKATTVAKARRAAFAAVIKEASDDV